MRHGQLLLVLCTLTGCATTVPETLLPVPSYAMTFEMDDRGAIKPYSLYVRNRTLEPKSEQEIRSVLAAERAQAPVREGHIAVRARDRWGRVIYRTLVEVVLVGHTLCCPHEEFRVNPVAMSVIIPATATSVSFEGWRPVSRIRFDIDDLVSAYGGDS